jgi:adenylate cyclase
MGNAKSINKLVEQAYQSILLPGNTQEWVDALKQENLNKLRKLFKKLRKNLPAKYRRLYLEPDSKLEIALHFLRISYPFFTETERNRSQKFLELAQKKADGLDPINQRFHL